MDLQHEELRKAVMMPRDRRTPQQVLKLTAWLSAHAPALAGLPSHVMHILPKHLHGWELYPGQAVYSAGDAADAWFVVLDGTIQFTDARDSEEACDPIVGGVTAGASWGEEEILSASRRAFTATAQEASLLMQLSASRFKELLADLHVDAFESKVSFLCSLSPLKPLKEEVVRRLAPCFLLTELHKGDFVVKQGERADAMYVIRSGSCAVLVDPHFKEDSGDSVACTDPKKTVQVVTLEAGAIIGDVTVLAKVHRRTASVQATSEVVALKIRKTQFLRRLPQDQLEILRHLAGAKLKLMEKKVAAGPANKGLQNQILQGHNLRQLMHQQLRVQGNLQEQPEEYQQLIYVLRRYKRTAAPANLPKGAPVTFAARWQGPSDAPSTTSQGSPRRKCRTSGGTPCAGHQPRQMHQASAFAQALHASIHPGAASGTNISPAARARASASNPTLRSTAHADWQGRTRQLASASDGGAAVTAALLRTLPPALIMPEVSAWPGGSSSSSSSSPASPAPHATAAQQTWRPVSGRRCIAHGKAKPPALLDQHLDPMAHGQAHHCLNYHANPFVASITLRTLAAPLVGTGRPEPGSDSGVSACSSPSSLPAPGSLMTHSEVWSSSTLLGGGCSAGPGARGVSACRVPRRSDPARSATPPLPLQANDASWLSKQLALDFHTDLDAMMGGKGPPGGSSRAGSMDGHGEEPTELEAALDALAKPLLQARPPAIRQGTAHFRPTISRALL